MKQFINMIYLDNYKKFCSNLSNQYVIFKLKLTLISIQFLNKLIIQK